MTDFLTMVTAAQQLALQVYNVRQIGDVDGEPITIEEARAQCNVDINGSPPESDDDFWLETIGIPAARQYCENYKGISYAPRTMEMATNSFQATIKLPFGPVQSIDSVKYDDQAAYQAAYDAAYTAAYDAEFMISADVDLATAAGIAAGLVAGDAALEVTIDPSVYLLNLYTNPATIILRYGQAWPTTVRSDANTVRIRYIVGMGLPGDSPIVYVLPPTAKGAMLLMLAHLFENRAAVNIGGIVTDVPFGVRALLDLTLGGERTDFA